METHTIKDYRTDLQFFIDKLLKKQPFSFARFNDGELYIILKEAYYCYDFQFDPDFTGDKLLIDSISKKLKEALSWQHENYFVGIICPHCFGTHVHEQMKKMSKQPLDHLTWGSLFYNANYIPFLKNMIPFFAQTKSLYFLGSEKGDFSSLPFKVKKYYPLPRNLWKKSHDEILEVVKEDIIKESIEEAIFLICAGPSAAILVKELCAFSPSNTYLDMGSVFDLWLFKDASRNYLRGVRFTPCKWNN